MSKGGIYMIHFNNDIVYRTLKAVKESHDCIDMINGLQRIDNACYKAKYYNNINEAISLDQELRQKYPYIDKMINFANSFYSSHSKPVFNCDCVRTICDILIQDYYGILYYAALKKEIINRLEEFITKVD